MRILNPFPSQVTALLTWLSQILLTLLFVMLLSPAQALTLDEVGGGELLFKTTSGWEPSLQLGTRVDMQISGMVARVTVEQRFHNTQTEWAEGSYVFPLPETAAVSEMTITVDDRIIVGEINEKQAAEKIYKQAKASGKRSALLDQSKSNLFRTRIANLGPDQEISVTLTYLEKVSYDNGEFSLRFPMTVTARYDVNARSLELPAADPALQPHFELPGVPRNPVQITASIDAGLSLAEIVSPYHPIHKEQLAGKRNALYKIALANNIVPMDRDFVLSWRPDASNAPQAALFAEEIAGDTYAMLMIMPPERGRNTHRLDRELIFIIDTSGSMDGAKIEAAREALVSALGTLGANDRFNIIAFDDNVTRLFREAKLAAGSYLQDGLEFVNGLEADRGTNMKPALQAALKNQPVLPPTMLRQVVFITDGAVWAEDELFRLINDELGDSRLFTVGIGSAPNSHFMRKAAQYGRGTFTYIANTGEAQQEMARLFKKLASPQLRNLQVNWSGTGENFPSRVPDLYAGEPLLMTARINGTYTPLVAHIKDGNDQWQQDVELSSVSEHAGIATLWARDKLESLYDRITEKGESSWLRQEIVKLGLQHKLVSRYTSFVAVEQIPVRPFGSTSRNSRVPNALPTGQVLRLRQVLGLPQTATTTFENLLFGSLFLLLAMFSLLIRARLNAHKQ